jgi:hypothetical protein
LLNANDELFEAFIKKYYPNNTSEWLNSRKVLSNAKIEVAAYNLWRNIESQIANLSGTAYKNINKFEDKYANTEVYKNVKSVLIDYQKIVQTIYPEAIIDRLKKSLSMQSKDSKVFSAYNRYYFLKNIQSEKKLFLQKLFHKKMRLLSEGRNLSKEFGIFTDVPCGTVYSNLMASRKNATTLPAYYIPALLDIDAWSYINKSLKKNPKLKIGSLKKNTKQYPFFLYASGLVAYRYEDWELLNKIFSDYKKNVVPNNINHALSIDLAIKSRQEQFAWEVFAKYNSFQSAQVNEIIISLLKIQALLNFQPIDEVEFAELITALQKRFAKYPSLSGDLKALTLLRQFVCAEFKEQTIIKTNLFTQTTYPHLHACLWLEATARDKILQRNSIKIVDLIKASRLALTPSAFRSTLFEKITWLSLGYKNLTPSQLLAKINESLAELKPCATDSYPSLIILLFATELFNQQIVPKKLAKLAKDYSVNSPIFSPTELQFANILRSSNPFGIIPKNLQAHPLWMLAAAKAKRSGKANRYIERLKSFGKNLRWTEQLLINRFIQLLENY